jgi:hypothetical protein
MVKSKVRQLEKANCRYEVIKMLKRKTNTFALRCTTPEETAAWIIVGSWLKTMLNQDRKVLANGQIGLVKK